MHRKINKVRAGDEDGGSKEHCLLMLGFDAKIPDSEAECALIAITRIFFS